MCVAHINQKLMKFRLKYGEHDPSCCIDKENSGCNERD